MSTYPSSARQSSSTSHSRSGRGVRPSAHLDGLVVEAQRGSAEALDLLIAELSKQLWAELTTRRRSRRANPSHGSSDLVQDTLIRAREQFEKFERSTFADFKQWARKVLFRRRQEWTRNHLARNAERHKRMIWSVVLARGDGPHANDTALSIEQREELDRAYALYQCLKPNEQCVIHLRLFEGLSYQQIAMLTNSTAEAARKAYDRALDKLRRSYANDDTV
ncbi:MAG: sigma-70 family RNA polymerase sigma factor [Pirellulales bacterium]|nr:sigma-70 family RNA polymerase sigma factor [Pirellulales bacterium]